MCSPVSFHIEVTKRCEWSLLLQIIQRKQKPSSHQHFQNSRHAIFFWGVLFIALFWFFKSLGKCLLQETTDEWANYGVKWKALFVVHQHTEAPDLGFSVMFIYAEVKIMQVQSHLVSQIPTRRKLNLVFHLFSVLLPFFDLSLLPPGTYQYT